MIDKGGHPVYIDFLQWWVGSQFSLMRNPAGAYNYSTFAAAEFSVTKTVPPVMYIPWVYPPTMFLLVAPLVRLPYAVAFFAWISATLCFFVAALYAIVPCSLSVVLALLPLPAVKNVFDGQTAFLISGLLGLSMVLSERRPYLSGVCLGILTYKPQYVVFFPVALVITGQWRVIAGAIAGASLFAGAAALVFGSDVWLEFFRFMLSRPATVMPHNLVALNQTVFGLMREAGSGTTGAWIVHLTVLVLVIAVACQIWLRPVPHALKAAAFSIGALMMTPYMLGYDLTALAVPAAFLVKDALDRGFAPGERFVLTGCFFASFLFFNFVVGPVILLVLLGLVVRRVRHPAWTSAAIAA
ncbi:MAG TPA: glycosyltransferase family 87 protein [Candidatus Binataceae bacterium]